MAKSPAKTAEKSAKKTPTAKKVAEAAKASSKKAAPAKPKGLKVTAAAGKAVTQSELMQLFADQQGISKAEAKRLVDGYLDIVKAHVVKGVKVKLGDLGTIMMRQRKARTGRNPKTGEPMKIKASKTLAFRQSATMRDAVR